MIDSYVKVVKFVIEGIEGEKKRGGEMYEIILLNL
jgi:hypothetical protein